MNSSSKVIVGILIVLILAVLMVTSYFLYSYLTEDYSPGSIVENSYPDNSTDNQNDDSNTQNSSDTNVDYAPDFTVTDQSGNKVKLSDMRGKSVVVNFWASWCPPCKAEMPDFETLYKQYGNEVVFMMVNMTDGYQETTQAAQKYIEECNYTFPVYFDTEYQAANAYTVNAIPQTHFINSNGSIAHSVKGMIDYERLKKGIEGIK